MSRAFPIVSCELCHILQRLYLYSSDESIRTCACCTVVGRRSESPDSYYPSFADEQLMNASIQTTQTSYMTAPEYLDDQSGAGYEADDEEDSDDDDEEDSDDESGRRNSYDSMMDFLRRTYAEAVQCQGIPPYPPSSEEDGLEMADDDILSTASESRASTPEWLDEPSIPPFMVPSLTYKPDRSHLFPGAMSPTDSSTYTSSSSPSTCSTPATSQPHPWSTISPTFSQLSFSFSSSSSSSSSSSDDNSTPGFETPSPPPFHRKSIAYPGEPGYDPHDHPEYILFGIQPDRRQKRVELAAPKPNRPLQEGKVRELCENWGTEEVVAVGGRWDYEAGETMQRQQLEEHFFHWWREEERRAWELFDVDAMGGIQAYGQRCNVWGSEGLPRGQGRMMGLCC